MAIDTAKFTTAITDLQNKVSAIASTVQSAATDEAAAQKAIDDGVVALTAATQTLAALLPAPPTPPAA